MAHRILVISDLHAVDNADLLRTEAAMNYAQRGAPRSLVSLCWMALSERFPDEGIDLILVAGDMTDKAGSGPLSRVWADLQWLGEKLGAEVVATAGNHDYDSRATHGAMPKRSLMELEPPFPFGTDSDRDMYFARDHAVYVDEKFVVVTANSAAHHGYIPQGELESEHGRFGDYLPTSIDNSLKAVAETGQVRIFLTHHHLNQLPGFDFEERSFSIGHEEVLRTLGEHGDWLIVHGHKHRGWLQYASGTGDSPPMLSASSFAADFGSGPFADKVRHQFHVIEVDPAPPEEGITGPRGAVHSWTHSELGWSEASREEDLPGFSGFGWKTNVRALAERIRSELLSRTVMDEFDLETFEPRLQFLTFDDQRRLVRILEGGGPTIVVDMYENGKLRELAVTEDAQ